MHSEPLTLAALKIKKASFTEMLYLTSLYAMFTECQQGEHHVSLFGEIVKQKECLSNTFFIPLSTAFLLRGYFQD